MDTLHETSSTSPWRQVRVAVSAGRGEAGHEVTISAVIGDGHTDPTWSESLQVRSVF